MVSGRVDEACFIVNQSDWGSLYSRLFELETLMHAGKSVCEVFRLIPSQEISDYTRCGFSNAQEALYDQLLSMTVKQIEVMSGFKAERRPKA